MKTLLLLTLFCIGGRYLSFAQDNTIPTTGNVGLGTMTPSARLDVNGNMKVDSCLHVKDSLLIEDNARIMSDMRVEGETTLLGNTKIEGEFYLPNIQENNTFLGKLLFADSTGKVEGGTPFDLAKIIYSKQCAFDPFGDVLLPVWNNGLNKIYVDCPPVRVGIGTSEPDARLQVVGLAHVGNLMVGTMNGIGANARIHIHTGAGSNSNFPLLLAENNDRRLLQLDADGILRAREVIVDEQIWPDYVFLPNYDLMPLKEIEAFIQLNGHLPKVPSQEEAISNGINLGDMNRILLEKIEELTLHIIEQEKRITELEQK